MHRSRRSTHRTVKVESILLIQTRLPLQTESTAQQLLCPPVVVQTRPMEGCHTAMPRRSRRGRDVRTADDAVAVDIRPVSIASDTVVSRKMHRKSECVTAVVPKLAAAPQAAYETSRLRLHGLTPSGERVSRFAQDCTPEAAVSSMEVAGGSPPAEINISRSPDRLQTELAVATTEMDMSRTNGSEGITFQ